MKMKTIIIITTISIILSAMIIVLLYVLNLNMINTKIPSFVNQPIANLDSYAKEKKISIIKKEIYNDIIQKGYIIDQVEIDKHSISVTISLGKDMIKLYQDNNVNELGLVPIMMYHGIVDVANSTLQYIGGNVDKDGYNRSSESFRNDLEFYYLNNYRMIRLTDYIDSKIDVAIGKSPIILTFDDGRQNNINVLGLDNEGNIIIDPNSAVGILEAYKKKYPDYNVTATFFLSSGLFQQPKYNTQIIKWLIANGYDIGNHSYQHKALDKITASETSSEIARMYGLLSQVTDYSYVNIVALPFGTPTSKSHSNYPYIINSSYGASSYQTKSTLRVGWDSNVSPFCTNFDHEYLKRIRAYDNNGVDFDITMNFNLLKDRRYISDGDATKIVVKKGYLSTIKNVNSLEVVTY